MSGKTFLKRLLSATTALTLVASVSPSALALVVRDDVTVEGSEDYANDTKWDGAIQLYLLRNSDGAVFFNCSGTLINPRTVISAAHCFNSNPSTAYGFDSAFTPIIAYGPNTFDALFGWLNQPELEAFYEVDERNGLVLGNQVIIHPDADPAFGFNFDFPAADVALVSLSNPLANLPTYAMLFSPVGVGEHVSMATYGSHGTGSFGTYGIDGKRQAGENVIGMVGSSVDFLSAIFGTDTSVYYTGYPPYTQSLYWIDFDNPNRTGDECGRDANGDWRCTDGYSTWLFTGSPGETIYTTSPSNDIFPDDALPYESGTAPGDSGSAIFFDQLTDQPLIGGVLSGGWGFVSPVSNGYSDVSYYNPLFNFYDFIVEGNPYKYVSANAGDGNWSDPTHWVQDLDPGYFIIDDNGNVVNGIPDSPEPGVASTGPHEGTVLDVDVSTLVHGDEIFASTGASDTGAAPSSSPGTVFSMTPTGEPLDMLVPGTSELAAGSVYNNGAEPTPELVTFLYGDIGSPGPLAGPGSTNFVPNNGLNDIGFFNYFDVTLSNAGTTTVDIDATVDALKIMNTGANLDILIGNSLTALIDTQNFGGTINNDGVLVSRDILNYAGVVQGTGWFFTDTFWNAGLLNPGEGMQIFGDLVLTSGSVFGYSGDSVHVTGDVSVDGAVAWGTNYAYGDTGTLISYGGSAVGGLGDTDLAGVLYATYAVGDGVVSYDILAESFESQLAGITDPNILAAAGALDNARNGGYSQLSSIFGIVDYLSGSDLEAALRTLLPTGSYEGTQMALFGAEQIGFQLRNRFQTIRAGGADGVAFNKNGVFGVQTASMDGMSAFALSAEAATSEAGAKRSVGNGSGVYLDVHYMTGDGHNALSGVKRDVDGMSITAGYDFQADPQLRLGAFVNYNESTSDSASLASAESSGYSAGLYAQYDFKNDAAVSGYVGYGELDIDMARAQILTGGLATASTNATVLSAGIQASKAFYAKGGTAVEGVAGFDYNEIDVDGYVETGTAGSLAIGDSEVLSARGRIGALAHFNQGPKTGTFALQPSIGVSYVNDAGTDTQYTRAQFTASPTSAFVVASDARDSDWFEVEGRLKIVDTETTQISGFVTQTVDRDDLEYTSLGVKLHHKF